MRKLLIIGGLTATGKTSLALHLSKLLNGEIISADSRQIYKGMDIDTGKDLPSGAKLKESDIIFNKRKLTVYETNGTKIWGLDLVSPFEEFSVSHFSEIAEKILNDIWQRKKLPIIVGGAGFYIKAVIDGIETTNVPMSESLRKELEVKTVNELFSYLQEVNPDKASLMNESDKKNPRRLIRAIEVSSWLENNNLKADLSKGIRDVDIYYIALKAPKELIEKNINKRVEERIDQGVQKEIEQLLESGVTWELKSMNTLGYKEWKGYFEGKYTLEEVKNKWIIDEIHYAKRQLTWFKKDERISWFDITEENWQKKVEISVEKWHNINTN